jgi:8-hydroxy-5-deazaflavin:NADPH oxidoreductase
MALKQTIAIIGASGRLGSAVAFALSRGNYRLLLMGQDVEALDELKTRLLNSLPKAEVESIGCAREAAWESDIIIIASPYESEKEIVEKIKEVAVGKVVISISRPARNYGTLFKSSETSAAEELQKMLPHSKVVKTFNSVFAKDSFSPVINEKTGEAFIAGNSSDALEAVSKLVLAAGFMPIVVGDLSVSRRLETIQFY